MLVKKPPIELSHVCSQKFAQLSVYPIASSGFKRYGEVGEYCEKLNCDSIKMKESICFFIEFFLENYLRNYNLHIQNDKGEPETRPMNFFLAGLKEL